MKENKGVILLNNLFNGKYIEAEVGGEIINMYRSDNGNYYVYANPYGNVNEKWDNQIKHILFIRSVGNRVVKVIGKAEIEYQISIKATRKINKGIDSYQKKYIDDNNITYGNVKIYELGSWSSYFATFKAKQIFKAKTDIYLALDSNEYSPKNTFVIKNTKAINNQSQKLYIEPDNVNYDTVNNILQNADFWESKTVGKVNISNNNKLNESFLSIIRKENDELVNSNLLAHFLEKDKVFWSDFVQKVLKITDKDVINNTPKITKESIANIDLFIEIGEYVIVIENKIKSRINGKNKSKKGYSQLEKYIEKTKEHLKKDNKKNISFYILRPNYNNEDYTIFNKGNEYKEIKYSEIYEIIKERNSGFYFEEFKRVVKKHSAEYDNELFEIVNERFIEQIKKMQ